MLNKFNTLYLETTRNCNLSCKYCSSGSNKIQKSIDLPYDVIVNRILKPAYDLGTRLINFSGGEFLIRQDSIKLLNYANSIGYDIALASNGLLLTEDNLKKIKDAVGNNIIISLGINSFDSDNKETRELDFQYTLKIIERLEKYNFRVNISVTMGDFNKYCFEETINKIQELKLPFNRIPFVPRNCNMQNLMVSKDSLKNWFHPELIKNFNGQVSYTPYFLPKEIYEQISGQNLNIDQIPINPNIGCWVGAYYAINPEGDVSPCPMFLDHVTAGNVLKTPLYDILYRSEMFNKITDRKNLEGKCGNCKFTYTCGGCRVLSYYYTGNVYAEDPTCFIDDLSEIELKNLESQTVKSFKNYVRMAKFGNLYQYPSKNKQ